MRVFTTIIGITSGALFCCGIGATEPPIVDPAPDAPVEAPDALEASDVLIDVPPTKSTTAAAINHGGFKFRLLNCAPDDTSDVYFESVRWQLEFCLRDRTPPPLTSVVVENKQGVLRRKEDQPQISKPESALYACLEKVESRSPSFGCDLWVSWRREADNGRRAENHRRTFRSVVREQIRLVRACYSGRELRLSGSREPVLLDFRVRSGRASEIVIRSLTPVNPELSRCVEGVLESARFPVGARWSSHFISLPLRFEARSP